MIAPTAALVAAPPTEAGVMVTIPSLDNGVRQHGPCIGWPRPDGGRQPARGDKALVVEDNSGQLWLVAWEPTP